MSEPITPDILIVYLDPSSAVQSITLSQNDVTVGRVGVLVSVSGLSTGVVIFVPYSRILAMENVDGGTMPTFP